MFIASLKALLFLFMVLLCLFLILIVLIQRGKGGGLVGAFGGMGGSSAFGGKTSDVFVKITVWTAIIWFVTCIGGRYVIDMNSHNSLLDQASGGAIGFAAVSAVFLGAPFAPRLPNGRKTPSVLDRRRV